MTCLHNHDQIIEFLRKIFLKGFQIYQNYLCALILKYLNSLSELFMLAQKVIALAFMLKNTPYSVTIKKYSHKKKSKNTKISMWCDVKHISEL